MDSGFIELVKRYNKISLDLAPDSSHLSRVRCDQNYKSNDTEKKFNMTAMKILRYAAE